MVEIIAEIGQNHNGDMNLAYELIHSAKENGADIVKFQLFNSKELFTKKNNPWFDYNCKTEISKEQLFLLYNECNKVGIEFLASAFDIERVIWLEELRVKRYKIASRSINNFNLINSILKTKKPLIVSLGMWNKPGFPILKTQAKIDFLYCVSKYPTNIEDLNFKAIDFNKYSGFSDHTIGLTASMIAISRGAKIIEKHFTLDKKFYGPDHKGSMTPSELEILHQFRLEAIKCI